MKYIKKYEEKLLEQYIQTFEQFRNLFEFNRKDKQLILSSGINDAFTVAFEFELETDDDKYVTRENNNTKISNIKKEYIDILNNKGIKYTMDSINNLIDLLDLDDIEETINYLLDEFESNISLNDSGDIQILIDLISKYDDMDDINDTNIDYGISMVEKNLPNFYNKYHKELKFEFDMSLNNGIEFSPLKYVFSLNNAIEMINDFYNDFDKQDYWKMKSSTSIHINIGFTNPVEWNVVKGLIMLCEIKKDDVPFVYKGIESRVNTKFTKSLLKHYKKSIETIRKQDIRNIKEIEKLIQKKIGNIIKRFGAKTFSVNIDHIKDQNYVEFRHVGGDVNKETLIDKTMYFAYIAYLMTSNYKDKDYHKKLYKYIYED